MQNGIERRRYERFNLPLTAVVEYRDGRRQRTELTQLCNIGIGGALIPLCGNPSPDTELRLNLMDGDNHLANALGITVPEGRTLQYGVSGKILRRQNGSRTRPSHQFAIEFSSPLRIVTRMTGAH